MRQHTLLLLIIAVLICLISLASSSAQMALRTQQGGADRYAVAPLCCPKCSTGKAGCCCPRHNSLPLTTKIYKFTKTRTIIQTRTATKSGVLEKRSSAGEPELSDKSTPEVHQNQSLILVSRNQCPICPVSPAGGFVSPSQANRFCCPKRKTVTKTVSTAKTVTKKVIVTITAKPQQKLINLVLTIMTTATNGSQIPLANTPIIIYSGTFKARALNVLVKTKTNSTGSANVTVPAPYVNTTLTVVNANTSEVVSNFTVPASGGSVIVSQIPSMSWSSIRSSTTSSAQKSTTAAPHLPTTTTSATKPTSSASATRTTTVPETRTASQTPSSSTLTGTTSSLSATSSSLTETQSSTTLTTSTSQTATLTPTALTTTTHYRPECALGGGVTYGSGTVLPVAGTGDWGNGLPGTSSQFRDPYGMVLGNDGNSLVIADTQHNQIRLFNISTGLVTTIAGIGEATQVTTTGPSTSMTIDQPRGIATDINGNIYVTDNVHHRISKLTPDGSGGYITSHFAGKWFDVESTDPIVSSGDGGQATSAQLNDPWGIATRVDGSGNVLVYFAERRGNRIRVINTSTGIITTVAGNGNNAFAGEGIDAGDSSVRVAYPRGLAMFGNSTLYIADSGSNSRRIRKIEFSTNTISTVYGDGTSTVLQSPYGITVVNSTMILIADRGACQILAYHTSSPTATVLAGISQAYAFSGDGGPATSAELNYPSAAVWTQSAVYILDQSNNRVRSVDLASGTIQTVAGTAYTDWGGDGSAAPKAQLLQPRSLYVDWEGNVFFSELFPSRIRMINASGVVSTIAGTGINNDYSGDGGPGTAAELNYPRGLTRVNNNLHWAESRNHVIRVLDLNNGLISTVAGIGQSGGHAGDGGPATLAQLNEPTDVKASNDGSFLVIADRSNNAIRKLDLVTKNLTTIAGTLCFQGSGNDDGPALTSQFGQPSSIALDKAGNIFIADDIRNVVKKLWANLSSTITFAGQSNLGGGGGDGGPATSATLQAPNGLAVDQAGNIYISDSYDNVVRKVNATTRIISRVLGNGTSVRTWPFGLASRPGISSTIASFTEAFGLNIDRDNNIYVTDPTQKIIVVALGTPC